MKKDITIALIAGFLLGTIVAFSLIRLPSLLKKQNKISQNLARVTPSVTVSISTNYKEIEIKKPQDGEVVDEDSIEISGKTKASSIVVIQGENEQIAAKISDDGSFSEKLALSEGANNIEISTFEENGKTQTKTLTVFYTPEKI